ncbi:hypothetical protein MMC27_007742 [Xylographa pallens]|nr:hypothetical protein [Xylographa pallens]
MAQPLATVGILSIGDMGLGIAKLLTASNFRVVTNVSDRSKDTHRRASSASVELLPTDIALVEQADYILSIVPPRDAFSIARRIEAASRSAQRQQSTPLYFLDLNAVSPATSKAVAAHFSSSPAIRLLDGGIIGGPPKLIETPDASFCTYKPSVVVSGPYPLHDAPENGQHLAQLLNVKHISAEIGPASGLKMCFAAMSKGFTAIAIESFTTAERMGVLPELQAHLKEYNPSAGASATRGLVGMPPKAYRWVAEMEEIARTMEEFGGFRSRGSGVSVEDEDGQESSGKRKGSEGRGGDLFRGVSDVYRFVADETRLGQEKTESRERGMTVEDVATLCVEAMVER